MQLGASSRGLAPLAKSFDLDSGRAARRARRARKEENRPRSSQGWRRRGGPSPRLGPDIPGQPFGERHELGQSRRGQRQWVCRASWGVLPQPVCLATPSAVGSSPPRNRRGLSARGGVARGMCRHWAAVSRASRPLACSRGGAADRHPGNPLGRRRRHEASPHRDSRLIRNGLDDGATALILGSSRASTVSCQLRLKGPVAGGHRRMQL